MTVSSTPRSKVLPGSFRDPSGFLFERDGVLYRQVNSRHRPHYDLLMGSGLYGVLTKEGLLISHEEDSVEAAALADAYKVIRPEVVDFVSYPYEWSFEQLKDGALTTLRVQKRALDHGMSLRDASGYNIQFQRGRPLLIDTLSFESLSEGKPWVAYRQFCQHFLAPLALMSYRDVRLGQLLRVHIDGVPLELASNLMPFRARFRIPLLLHLFIHARTQQRYSRERASRGKESTRSFSLQAFRGLLDSLTGAIEKLRVDTKGSAWVEYYDEASHYSGAAIENKKKVVASFIDRVAPSTVWDLGANTGLFSRIAADQGIKTVAFDMDPSCVDANYKRVRAKGEPDLLPLLCDLTNPSPALGWGNDERMSLQERGPADLVLALALIHHLAIANNVPLPLIAEYLASLSPHLIIEFVAKEDQKVRQLLASRHDIFPHYTRAGFEEAFKERFDTERVEEIEGSERVLYLMRTR